MTTIPPLLSDMLKDVTDMIIDREFEGKDTTALRKLRDEIQAKLNRGETYDVKF